MNDLPNDSAGPVKKHECSLPAPSASHYFLGLFILGQLLFLLIANLLVFLQDIRSDMPTPVRETVELLAPGWPNGEGHLWELSNAVTKLTERWAQLTGQLQSWSLFAPDVGTVSIFPALELRWDAEPRAATTLARLLAPLAAVGPFEAESLLAAAEPHSLDVLSPDTRTLLSRLALLGADSYWARSGLTAAFARPPERMAVPGPRFFLSANEPADIQRYFRVGHFRLRRFENSIVLNLTVQKGETSDERNRRWARDIESHTNRYGDILLAYLRWRTRTLAEKHELPVPRQAILWMRRYEILDPGQDGLLWRGPDSLPVARWQPQVRWQPEYRPLEPFNPYTQRFESQKK